MSKFENPWKLNYIKKIGEIYNSYQNADKNVKLSDNEFSWILPGKDYELLSYGHEKSFDWGVPNQVIGNPEKANLFLCLFNPRTTSVKFDDKNPSAYPKDVSEYIDQENDDEIKTNPEDYYYHIIYDDNGNDEQRENVVNREINGLRNSYNGGDVKYNNQYYLSKYYHFLFKYFNDEPKELVYKRLIDNNYRIDNLKVCDLELFPYRSDSLESVKKGNLKELSTSKYVANLIVDRISKNEDTDEKEKLYFVFRTYFDGWENVLKEGINRYNKENNKTMVYDEIREKYFYEFSSGNGSITKQNIIKARSTNKKGTPKVKLTEAQYAEIKRTIGLDNQLKLRADSEDIKVLLTLKYDKTDFTDNTFLREVEYEKDSSKNFVESGTYKFYVKNDKDKQVENNTLVLSVKNSNKHEYLKDVGICLVDNDGLRYEEY